MPCRLGGSFGGVWFLVKHALSCADLLGVLLLLWVGLSGGFANPIEITQQVRFLAALVILILPLSPAVTFRIMKCEGMVRLVKRMGNYVPFWFWPRSSLGTQCHSNASSITTFSNGCLGSHNDEERSANFPRRR